MMLERRENLALNVLPFLLKVIKSFKSFSLVKKERKRLKVNRNVKLICLGLFVHFHPFFVSSKNCLKKEHSSIFD